MSFLGVQHYLGFWGLKERQSLTRCCAGKQNKMLGILVTGVAPDFLGCCLFIRVARSSRFGDHWRFAVWGASTTAPKWIIWQIRKSPHQSSPDFWVDFRVIMGHQLPKLNNCLPQGCDCMPSHFFRYQVSQSCNLVPLVPIHAHLVCYVCCNLTLVLVKDWCDNGRCMWQATSVLSQGPKVTLSTGPAKAA